MASGPGSPGGQWVVRAQRWGCWCRATRTPAGASAARRHELVAHRGRPTVVLARHGDVGGQHPQARAGRGRPRRPPCSGRPRRRAAPTAAASSSRRSWLPGTTSTGTPAATTGPRSEAASAHSSGAPSWVRSPFTTIRSAPQARASSRAAARHVPCTAATGRVAQARQLAEALAAEVAVAHRRHPAPHRARGAGKRPQPDATTGGCPGSASRTSSGVSGGRPVEHRRPRSLGPPPPPSTRPPTAASPAGRSRQVTWAVVSSTAKTAHAAARHEGRRRSRASATRPPSRWRSATLTRWRSRCCCDRRGRPAGPGGRPGRRRCRPPAPGC